MEEIFNGLKVLEFSSVLAGPMVGTFFAELGAEVTKIENPLTMGDPTRQWKLPSEEMSSQYSSYYASANYQKTSLLLNLQDSADLEIAKSLIRRSNVILSNYSNSVAKKLGVDFETCKHINPHIIYGQLYAYSKEDERPGYDVVMQAECGYISMCGGEDHYAKMPVALLDIIAAHQLKEGILIAMLQNSTTPKARLVEVSLYDSSIASLANQASNYLTENHVAKRMGTQHPNIAPYGDLFKTKDNKYIILAIGSDSQFRKLVETLNLDQKISATFIENMERVSNREDLNAMLQSRIKCFNSADLTEKFRRNKFLTVSFLIFKQFLVNPRQDH